MKILVIIPRFLPDRVAGAELEAKWLSEEFVKEGHEVTILTEESEQRPEVSRENGVKVLRRIKNPRTARPDPYFECIKAWIEEDPDIVHLHHVYPTGLWAYIISRFSETPVYITTHAEIKGKDSDYDNIRSNRFKDFLCRIASRNIEKLVLCSSNLEKEAIDMGLNNDQFDTINNCVDLQSKETTRENYLETLDKYNVDRKDRVVFFISRLVEKKGIDVLIKAADMLEAEDTQFLIAGKGPKKEELKEMKDRRNLDNVKFLGFIPEREKYQFLQHSEIFAFPSYSEGLPLTILEAMREGSTILCSDIGGPDDVLNQENAEFFETGSAPDMKNKLEHLLNNPEIRQKKSEKAKSDIREYSPKKVGKKYLELFES